MNTSTVTTHTITVHVSDFLLWLSQNTDKINLQAAILKQPASDSPRDGRSLEIVFPVSQEFLDTFLRGIVSGLPQYGQYKLNTINSGDIVGTITWNT